MKQGTRKAVKAWMREHGWNQTRTAAYLNVTQGAYSRMLSGGLEVGIEHGFKLAELTGIPVEDLVTKPAARRILEDYAERSKSSATISR